MLRRSVLFFGLLFCITSEEGVSAPVSETSSESVAKEVSLHEDQSVSSVPDTPDQQDTEEALDKIEEDPNSPQDWIQVGPSQENDEGGKLLEEEEIELEAEELDQELETVESKSSKKPFSFFRDLFKK